MMKARYFPMPAAVRLVALSMLAAHPGRADAALITFDVSVDNATYTVGDVVSWQVTTTVSGSTPDNYGAAAVSFDLSDSTGETLQPATIGPAYSHYLVQSGGAVGTTGELVEVGVLNQVQLGSEVAKHGEDLGPLLLASGSFTVTQPGMHVLAATPGSSNEFFIVESGGLFGDSLHSAPYDGPAFNNATFNVASVPEPSSLVACAVVAAGLGIGSYRRRIGRRRIAPAGSLRTRGRDASPRERMPAAPGGGRPAGVSRLDSWR